MKAVVRPLYFRAFNDREMGELEQQINNLKKMYGKETNILDAVPVEEYEEGGEDAVLFPVLTGAAFSCRTALGRIRKPAFVITSSFGTVEMWDWEIVAYLRENLGMNILTPYQEELAGILFRAVAEKADMKGKKLLIFQDSPGEGMQAYIFKRFYWWEKECADQIEKAFGIKIEYRSWKEVNEKAREISEEDAAALWESRRVPCSRQMGREEILRAVKLYIAVRDEVSRTGDVIGVGSNCLNESMYSETTPCLAWEWMFQYDHIMWCCEGDLVSLITMVILYSALKVPVMMTNLYPFLVGMAALKHEKIDSFPEVEDSDNCALGVHCGYFGFAPSCFCTQWTLRPKVLEIVNDRAVAVDCRMECGKITMAKLHSDMKKLTVIEAEITDYVQYPGSDCRNGCLIRYRNGSGHRVMEGLSSHHAVILKGDVTAYILQMAKVYGFDVEIL